MNEATTATQEVPEEIERFDIIFRIQHVVMFTTFLLLSFTGWGLKYAHAPHGLSSIWIRVWGGAETAGLIHRIAGVAMLLDFIWHVLYLGYLFATKKMTLKLKTTVIPLPKDVFDVVQNFMYFLGLSKEKPRFGKFSYAQKFDYWASSGACSSSDSPGLRSPFRCWSPILFPRLRRNGYGSSSGLCIATRRFLPLCSYFSGISITSTSSRKYSR